MPISTLVDIFLKNYPVLIKLVGLIFYLAIGKIDTYKINVVLKLSNNNSLKDNRLPGTAKLSEL